MKKKREVTRHVVIVELAKAVRDVAAEKKADHLSRTRAALGKSLERKR